MGILSPCQPGSRRIDQIVLKAFAGRDRDWADIEGIIMRQTGQLDEAPVFQELLPLLALKEETTDASAKLKGLDAAMK
jgi:hypothetical protein